MRQLPGCLVIGFLSAVAGCTSNSSERFIFTADLPPDFSYSAIAMYTPAKGETCSIRVEDRPDLAFNRKWRREYKSESTIPLYRRVKGCRLSLYKIDLYINGVYGNDYGDFGRDSTSVFISDQFEQKYLGTFDITGKSILEGQCQWLFRTQGPNRRLSKGVVCKKIDAEGNVIERRPVGAYTLDALPGKTILLKITLASEETPGWGDTWVKFPNGWKRCLGEGIQDQRGYCRGNYKDFSTFKMADGRNCTLYPTCTE